jgi:inosine-uridine nucleoside N-ribohydrolase
MQETTKTDIYKANNFKYVILDNDGGGDDCQAIVVLDYYIRKLGKVLLGITCCDGNTFIDNVALNVLITQKVCGS